MQLRGCFSTLFPMNFIGSTPVEKWFRHAEMLFLALEGQRML